jgi:hypothetical protein
MIGALEFSRLSLLMIWECKTERGHSNEVEDAAGLDMTLRLGVPLWQDHHG